MEAKYVELWEVMAPENHEIFFFFENFHLNVKLGKNWITLSVSILEVEDTFVRLFQTQNQL